MEIVYLNLYRLLLSFYCVVGRGKTFIYLSKLKNCLLKFIYNWLNCGALGRFSMNNFGTLSELLVPKTLANLTQVLML